MKIEAARNRILDLVLPVCNLINNKHQENLLSHLYYTQLPNLPYGMLWMQIQAILKLVRNNNKCHKYTQCMVWAVENLHWDT